MQRFKVDLSLAQFIMFARGEHLDIGSIKFEAYDVAEAFEAPRPKKLKGPAATAKPRAKRRTKAEMEEARRKARDYSLSSGEVADAHQQHPFPWSDETMNEKVEPA